MAAKGDGVPTATWAVPASAITGVAVEASAVLADWRVRAPFVESWLRRTADLAGHLAKVDLVLEWDEQVGLISYDAYVDGRRLFGADDFIG